MKKPGKYYFSQMIKVNCKSISHFTSVSLFPKPTTLIMRNISDKSQIMASLQNSPPVFFKTVSVIKKQGKGSRYKEKINKLFHRLFYNVGRNVKLCSQYGGSSHN